MLIDTHAHLDFKDFDKDRSEVIKRAFEGGVGKIINVGVSKEISNLLKPLLPQTSEKIQKQIKAQKSEILFPKLT